MSFNLFAILNFVLLNFLSLNGICFQDKIFTSDESWGNTESLSFEMTAKCKLKKKTKKPTLEKKSVERSCFFNMNKLVQFLMTVTNTENIGKNEGESLIFLFGIYLYVICM